MLGSRHNLDKRVSLILSKCKDASERGMMGLEIAKMYLELNEFKTARSYLENYLQKNKEPTALVLLGDINEQMHDLVAALQDYRAAFEMGWRDSELMSKINYLLQKVVLPKKDLEFWAHVLKDLPESDTPYNLKLNELNRSVRGANNAHSLVEGDPQNNETCLCLISTLAKRNQTKELLEHCITCLNKGFHYDSASWFRSVLEILESLESCAPPLLLWTVRALSYMLLIRLTCSTSCLSDMDSLLHKLSFLRSFDAKSDPDILSIHQELEPWLYFYSAVYCIRCIKEKRTSASSDQILAEFLTRAYKCPNTQPLNDSQLFGPAFWDRIQTYHSEHAFQALCLQHTFQPSLQNKSPQASSSWDELMAAIKCQRLTEAVATATNTVDQLQPSAVRWIDSSLNSEYLSSISLDTLDKVQENLSLILWACARAIHRQDLSEDRSLTVRRVEFLFDVISRLFPKLHASCPPCPNTQIDSSSVSITRSETCQLDLMCFLMGAFLCICMRSLQAPATAFPVPSDTEGAYGIGLNWLLLPPCLLPASQLPSSIQLRWWAAVVDYLRKPASLVAESSDQASLIQCGLYQLRLLGRPARCLGKYLPILPTPLLLRVAYSLNCWVSSMQPCELKQHVVEWISGYWKAALQQYTFGPTPPMQLTSRQHPRILPQCAGSPAILKDRNSDQLECQSPRPQVVCHFLFIAAPNNIWWLGFADPGTSDSTPEKFLANFGLTQLLTGLSGRFSNHGTFSAGDMSLLRFVIRLLDKEDMKFPPESYQRCGQLLLTMNEHRELAASSSEAAEYDSLPSFVDCERARHYLNIGAGIKGFGLASTETHIGEYGTPAARTRNTPGSNKHMKPWNPTFFSSQYTPLQDRSYPHLLSDVQNLVPIGAASSPRSDSLLRNPQSINLASIPAEQSGGFLTDMLPHLQELSMAAFLTSWQSLIDGLSYQLGETKAELSRSRQLNEQLSKQLSETSKQLSDIVDKFTEFQKKTEAQSKVPEENASDACALLGRPIHELSQAISDLRQWMPHGMASAAVAAVNVQLGKQVPLGRHNDPSSSLIDLYGPPFPLGAAPLPAFAPIPMQTVPAPWRPPFPNPVSASSAMPADDVYRIRFPANVGATVTVANIAPVPLIPGIPIAPGTQPVISQIKPALNPSHPSHGNPGFVPTNTTPSTAASKSPTTTLLTTPPGPTSNRQPSHTSSGLATLTPSPVLPSFPVIPVGGLNAIRPTTAVTTTTGAASSTPSLFTGFGFSAMQNQPKSTTASAKSSAKPTTQPLFGFGNLTLTSPNPTASLFSPKSSEKSTPLPPKPNTLTVQSPSVSYAESPDEPHAEEYEPQIDFKPVLDVLPERVEEVTGEEEEDRLFSARARLFRYDKAAAAWKTRGQGELRILHHPARDAYRLVMRRDQVKKLCANHLLNAGLKLSPHQKDLRIAMWVARDFADTSEGKDEMFMVQFKSAETLSEFMTTFNSCVSKQNTTSRSESKPTVKATPNPKPTSEADDLLAKFAPKPGSWDCPTCLLHHEGDVQKCPACHTAKPGSNPSASTDSKPPPVTTSLFAGFTMGSGGFVFGQSSVPNTSTSAGAISKQEEVVSSSGISRSEPSKPTDAKSESMTSFRFGFANSSTTESKTDVKSNTTSGLFSSLNFATDSSKTSTSSGFTFTFGLQPDKTGSPQTTAINTVVSPTKDNSDNDQVEQVDESKLTFKPVVEVLPDEIEPTANDEGDVIFAERAKLYRWDSKVWRERGVGTLKLLRSATSGSVRCVMRRDQVLKVCCNHLITSGMRLKPMSAGDGRALTWWAIDFSEPLADEVGEQGDDSSTIPSGGRKETFGVRFKLVEHTQAFREAFEAAAHQAEEQSGHSDSKVEEKLSGQLKSVDLDERSESVSSDDVVVVQKPPEVTEEQISRARALLLPDNFFAFENGVLSGEPESMTAAEQAAEDALLDATIRQSPDSQQSPGTVIAVTKPSDAVQPSSTVDKPNETPNKDVSPISPALINGESQLNHTPKLFGSGLPDFSALCARMANSQAPLWGTPSTTWGTTCTPLFANVRGTSKGAADNGSADDPAEYDPHFDPVIPLPDLVQTKSGEESEVCIFLRRCRLYRFADNAWKERGIGDVKVLLLPDVLPQGYTPASREVLPVTSDFGVVQSARLLMRREQVLKLCLNQPISSDLPSFKPLASSKLGLCWVANDFSEGSANLETLAIRFKTEADLDGFKEAVSRAQSLVTKS